jgi:acyl-CoA synthetase (AMP-forming)/AMP-acid ligase II
MFEILAYNAIKGKITPTIPKGILDNISPNKRYAVILENGLDLAIILLDIFKKKAVAVPIVPSLTEKQKTHILEHADVDGIFCRVHNTIQFTKRVSQLVSPENHRYIIYTSGSTGSPKGVIQTEEAVVHNATMTAQIHGFSKNSPHATCLPLYHCNALMMSLIGCYLTDTPLVLLTSFEPKAYFKYIELHGVTTASIVPALLPELIKKHPLWPKNLRYLITAAAPLTKQLAKKYFDLYGEKIIQGYGLSEAVNFSFMMPLLKKEAFISTYLWNTPPVGLPMNGTNFTLVESGEVFVQGPNNMLGYWQNENATKQCLDDNNWLKTGDLGYFREGYLVLNGRIKETINRGGESLHPNELEERYGEFLETETKFIVVPTEHLVLDNEIGIVIDTFKQILSQTEQQSILNTFLNCELIPAAIAFKQVSRTSTGKPQRIIEGKSIYVFQGNYQDVLSAIWSLRYSRHLATEDRVKIERAINKVIPQQYKTVLLDEFNQRNLTTKQTQSNSVKSLLKSFLKQFFSFNRIISQDMDRSNITHSLRIKCLNEKTVHYLGFNGQFEIHDAIEQLKHKHEIVYFDIPKKLDNDTLNPVFFYGLNEKFIDDATYESRFNIASLDLKKYWYYISPIKFKNYVFVSLVVLGRNK